MINRRSFLGGTAAVVGIATLPLSAFAAAPEIHGDGFHDDTAGLQAALAGKPFRCVGMKRVVRRGDEIHIGQGSYRLSDTLDLTDKTTIVGGHFDGRAIPDGKAALLWRGGATIVGCHIEGAA